MPAKLANQQFILDANVLIDGIFHPFSYSSKVLKHVKERDIDGYVLDRTIDEAHSIIQGTGDRTGVYLTEHFDHALGGFPLRQVSPLTAAEVERYIHIGGGNDGAIAAAAVRDNLVVCTQDDDFYKAKIEGIDIRNPSETVLAARKYEMEPYVNFPGFLFTPQEGSIYIEAKTGWGDFANSARFTGFWDVLDAPGIGVLYLDLVKGDLTFSIDNGPTASVSLKDIPPGSQPIKVVVSYRSSTGVAMYRGHGKPRVKLSCQWTPTDNRSIGKVTIFNGRHGSFGAAADVRLIAGFDKYVSEKAANKMLSGRQPLLPQERFTLDELVEYFYS